MEKITRPQKMALFIIGTLLMVPVVIGILSVREDNDCMRKIEKDGIVTLGNMNQYYKRLNGTGLHATIVYSDGNNKYFKESPLLFRTFPINMPVYIKYSASDPNCVVVLMDSTVVIGSEKISYHKIKLKGWDYVIENLNK